jgi:hypothetical protein
MINSWTLNPAWMRQSCRFSRKCLADARTTGIAVAPPDAAKFSFLLAGGADE